ncbi:hypothetical protein GTQ40_00840 [Flavobacteriaceae bacterium R38]|nr:hypothetical protein [Flavobacteriaceae bacterium R38]
MHFTKENLIELHNRIVNFADENLQKINELNIDLNDEHDSSFVGMIIKQHSMNKDLSLLYSYKEIQTLTSEFILYRCLIDDYIHIIFISDQDDKNEMFTRLNADALSKNFKKLSDLAELNEEKLGGNYPYYPTYAMMEEVKQKMKDSPKRQVHFSNKDEFRFKTFKTTGNLIRDLNDNDPNSHNLRRAYFIWRKYSDFVHYSNLAYEEENEINPAEDSTYTEYAEIISYSYLVTLNCLQHFVEKYGLEIIDSKNLAEYYANTGHQ